MYSRPRLKVFFLSLAEITPHYLMIVDRNKIWHSGNMGGVNRTCSLTRLRGIEVLKENKKGYRNYSWN